MDDAMPEWAREAWGDEADSLAAGTMRFRSAPNSRGYPRKSQARIFGCANRRVEFSAGRLPDGAGFELTTLRTGIDRRKIRPLISGGRNLGREKGTRIVRTPPLEISGDRHLGGRLARIGVTCAMRARLSGTSRNFGSRAKNSPV
jgi:hypothetical protein